MTTNTSVTRQHILRAALKRFARCGYAATSVQQIVDDAAVSKPALYYYFADKAGLYQALVDQAHDERYRLMREAARRGRTVAEKLVEVVAAIFEFSLRNRELMRLAFATAFAAPGEMPHQGKCREKGKRNFEFIRALIEEGQAAGELDRRFSSEELAMGLHGPVITYVMVGVILAGCKLNRRTAERMVKLFLQGAAAGKNATVGAPANRSAKKMSCRVPQTVIETNS